MYFLKPELTVTIMSKSEFVGQAEGAGGALGYLFEFLHSPKLSKVQCPTSNDQSVLSETHIGHWTLDVGLKKGDQRRMARIPTRMR